MIDVIIGIISVSFLFFMVRIFMKFNSATYKNNFTKNDNFIVENVKVIKIVIAVCTCIIGAIWLLFVLICSKKGAETGNLIPTLIFTLVFYNCNLFFYEYGKLAFDYRRKEYYTY